MKLATIKKIIYISGFEITSFYPRASKQGNVIGLVSVYIYMCTKKIVIERTRDLIYIHPYLIPTH